MCDSGSGLSGDDGGYPAEKTVNILAAMRYLQARFGRSSASMARMTYAYNATGHGERVISPNPAQPDYQGGPELEVVPGTVTGYRWWTLPEPDYRTYPSDAEMNWPHGKLHGVQGDWQPGTNTAYCSGGWTMNENDIIVTHQAPAKGCGCGYWAYWQPQQRTIGNIPVFGAIRAWGRVRIGTRGFRAEKARILAVHLPLVLVPESKCRCGNSPRKLLQRNGVYEATPRRCGCAQLTPEQEAIATAHAEAWAAVIGDRLAVDYGVRVFETRDLLLRSFPPDPVYGSRECRRCGGDTVTGQHAAGCPEYVLGPLRQPGGSVTVVTANGGAGTSAGGGGGSAGGSGVSYGGNGSAGLGPVYGSVAGKGLAQWQAGGGGAWPQGGSNSSPNRPIPPSV